MPGPGSGIPEHEFQRRHKKRADVFKRLFCKHGDWIATGIAGTDGEHLLQCAKCGKEEMGDEWWGRRPKEEQERPLGRVVGTPPGGQG